MYVSVFIAAVSAGAVIIRTFWPAAITREPSSCGTDSPASGPKSTRCDHWAEGVVVMKQFYLPADWPNLQ